MHSSKMRTTRLLTISQHALGVYLPGGVYPPGGVPAWGGVPAQQGVPTWGCTCPGTPSCKQNDRQVQKYYLSPNFVCGR